jgi:hypothetical protein
MAVPFLALMIRDHAPNYTIPNDLCTLQTCSVETQAQLSYDPSLAGNAFYASLFGLLLFLQLLLGIYYRTWTYSIGTVFGLALELCGYIGRIKMHFNPFTQSPFFMYVFPPFPPLRSRHLNTDDRRYLISLTIGPIFLCASIYICFSRIITIYGSHLSRIRPKWIIVIFILSDFTSLVLQAGGGAIAVIANDVSFEYVGIHLMLAGLALQVFSLVVVLLLAADFAWRCARRSSWNERYESIRSRRYFAGFISGLLIATIAILVRSSFRVAELTGGFHGRLWNGEAYFMVLDGAMVAIASISLTVYHPGLAFHGMWEVVKAG